MHSDRKKCRSFLALLFSSGDVKRYTNCAMNRTIKPELIISILAVIIAITSAIASFYFSSVNLRTDVLPTLVLVYSRQQGWEIRNVGKGPALNVTIAHKNHGSDTWVAPTRLYPIPKDGVILTPWIGSNPDKIGITYTDVHNNQYTSLTDNDLTKIHKGRFLPSWTNSEVIRVWQH